MSGRRGSLGRMALPSPAEDVLSRPVAALRRVAPALAEELAGRGLSTVRDLLLHAPSRYEDRRAVRDVASAAPGERVVLLAEVRRPRRGRPRRGGGTLLCQIADRTGEMAAVWFHARPWQIRELAAGRRFFFTGAVKPGRTGGRVLFNPEYEPTDEGEDGPEPEAVHFGRVVPLYPGTAHPRAMRSLVAAILEAALPAIDDPLPAALRERHRLLGLSPALRELHFPREASPEELALLDTEARRRLAFDELLWLSLALARRRAANAARPGFALRVGEAAIRRAIAALPFPPTGAQARAISEIAADLASGRPMQRLLEGDVGSGKTAVAAVALRLTVESGLQGALMAPTELLAVQHGKTLRSILGPDFPLRIVTAGTGGARGAAALAEGRPEVAIGTHALIQGALSFGALALAVIDEQHRFGVEERLRLSGKGKAPHVLLMSATPIPRTLAIALRGDLDVSVLDELPPGRTPVETRVLSGAARARAMEALEREVAAGRQAYVVFPLIEESEKLDLANATSGAERIAARLPGRRVALVHGRMAPEERETRMAEFRDGRIDVLVATTVVEVGVDVPNATLMIVSRAERFGLSQLHQLRGRVGRGPFPSRCLLLAHGPLGRDARRRLSALAKSHDGFVIARMDLEIRGPGELLGRRQSGLPELTFADPLRQPALLEAARAFAFELAARDPDLSSPEGRRLGAGLDRLFGSRRSLGAVG